jgi:hypothetical protein
MIMKQKLVFWLKHVFCFFFGHKPRGPINFSSKVIYRCARCKDLVYFDETRRWERVDW